MAEHRMPGQMEAGRGPALRTAQSLAFLVGMGVCLALSLAFAKAVLERTDDSPTGALVGRINPNKAPVASLMRLPQIGAARAQAIVVHRDRAGAPQEQVPVFTKADDLRQIKGIGPAIVEGLRPWLAFDDPSQDANVPPMR